MDKVIVYVDDAAYARQVLEPLALPPLRARSTGCWWPAHRA